MRISGTSAGESYAFARLAPSQDVSKAASSRFQAAASQSTNTSLRLTTEEGDKVLLSYSSERSSAVASEGGDYSSLRSQRAQVNIQVEGDLSADELKDIQSLAKILSESANRALNGDGVGAAQGAAKAGALETIQTFAYSLNRQVGYQFSYQEEPVTTTAKTPAVAPRRPRQSALEGSEAARSAALPKFAQGADRYTRQ